MCLSQLCTLVCVVNTAYLIGCKHPSHPPAGGSSPADGSADSVVVVTLRFARGSFFVAPGSYLSLRAL